MKLLWQIDTQVDPRYLSLMQTAADCALWMEGVSRPCAVNIRICGDDAIHEINREYRGVDRATDVLSFPTVNYPAGKTAAPAAVGEPVAAGSTAGSWVERRSGGERLVCSILPAGPICLNAARTAA